VAGVTMIEMFITLFVLAIVLATGMPSAVHWVHQWQIRASAESLRSALQKTRAEAIARNTKINITLGDSGGLPQWRIGCARVTALCPNNLHAQVASAGSGIRWGAAKAAAAANISVALTAGAGLPATVAFHALGNAPRVVSGSEIARIDVLHPADSAAGRLVVRTDGAGNVSICDPALPVSDVRGCH
jgi:type IV fimbrial biogenesis protein FimT